MPSLPERNRARTIHRKKTFGGRSCVDVHREYAFSPHSKCVGCGGRPHMRAIVMAPFDEVQKRAHVARARPLLRRRVRQTLNNGTNSRTFRAFVNPAGRERRARGSSGDSANLQPRTQTARPQPRNGKRSVRLRMRMREQVSAQRQLTQRLLAQDARS